MARVYNEAGFHSTMRESADFNSEATLVMGDPSMLASSQDLDVGSMSLKCHSYTMSMTLGPGRPNKEPTLKMGSSERAAEIPVGILEEKACHVTSPRR